MPSLSLVVCLYHQRDLLERLLQEAVGLYDDLVVVHDGPEEIRKSKGKIHASTDRGKPSGLDFSGLPQNSPLPEGYVVPSNPAPPGSIHELAVQYGGKYCWGPRRFQQEPHWAIAWQRAKHDWILRLDADEFPSDEMKQWLQQFRKSVEPSESISGYTCIWPLWGGKRTVSRNWPAQRIFLFHRERVRFFGMVEQVPIPDGHYQALDLILHHQPRRKSYGLSNLLLRRQAWVWRQLIARSLLRKPTELPCWRWDEERWPPYWEQIRRQPIRTFFSRLILGTVRTLRDQWRVEKRFYPSAAISGPIHHSLICLQYSYQRWLQAR